MAGTLQRLPVFAAALWWGSLTTIGFLVVPMLFAHLPTPALAGGMAARLFAAQTWVSIACGLILLLIYASKKTLAPASRSQSAIFFVVFGMLLAVLVEFAVAPRIVARENLRLWHSAGSAMYLAQWLSAAAVFWRVTTPPIR